MKGKKQKSGSSLDASNIALTIYDAPNVCRELMAKSARLASRLPDDEAKKAEEIGALAKQMLDAIVTAVDQLLALPPVGQTSQTVTNNDLPVLANGEVVNG